MSDESKYHIAYALSPLPPGSWIRVLVLDPGAFADPITCTLQLHKLDQPNSDFEPYEAISYVWGDPTERRSIHVNGHVMHITYNLFAALRQLRSQDTSKRFWADAVCINQSDFPEKGKQVNNMGVIYSGAARVNVWLGPDDEMIAESAISVIKKFNQLVEKQVTPQQFSSGWGPLNDPERTVSIEQLKYAVKLFKKPWFTRVWVIQEVGVAKEVLFAWGSAKVDFAEIIQFICAWSTSYAAAQFPGVGFSSSDLASLFSYIWASYIPGDVKTFNTAWFKNSLLLQYEAQTMRETRTVKFEDIIFRCRRLLRATDTRDFVYAFLGHPAAKTTDGKPIVDADYTISEAELRLRLFSIISRRSLRFLGLVWHTHEEELAIGSTWCPKFDSIKYFNILERYDACHEQLPAFHDTFAPTLEGSRLKIGALLVDKIHLCGEVAGPAGKGFDSSVYDALKINLHEVMERYWSLAEQSNAQYSSAYTDRPMAFASTLIAAIEKDHQRVIAKRFEEFCRDHCPLINEHLQDGWLDKWGPSQPDDPYFPFRERTSSTIQSERFFTTIRGYYGMGSPLVQPGDSICIFPTAQTPFIIRRVEGEESTYRVICACYVYGIMFGDAVRKWNEDPASMQKVDIVLI